MRRLCPRCPAPCLPPASRGILRGASVSLLFLRGHQSRGSQGPPQSSVTPSYGETPFPGAAAFAGAGGGVSACPSGDASTPSGALPPAGQTAGRGCGDSGRTRVLREPADLLGSVAACLPAAPAARERSSPASWPAFGVASLFLAVLAGAWCLVRVLIRFSRAAAFGVTLRVFHVRLCRLRVLHAGEPSLPLPRV